MLEHPEVGATFEVRSWAPDVFLAGNIGGNQLRKLSTERLNRMLDQVGANALCVHLNPAQELVQPEGDRDFRGVLEAIGRVARELERPLIVKETGAGLNRRVGLALREVGVKHVDVAGVGGTSWVGAELRRMGQEHDPELGAFWDWGVPTAAAIAGLARSGLEIVGSGGIRTGLDVARALALGARMCGLASPVIQAFFQGGEESAERYLAGVCNGLKMSMLLCGARTTGELRGVARHVSRPLRDWLTDQAAKR
jgi:isopentenyl-diphosphate delta-isomerase